jgi:hypothetical protein
MKLLRRLWNWISDFETDSDIDHLYSRRDEYGRAKVSIFLVLGFILILIIVFAVIWIDEWARNL